MPLEAGKSKVAFSHNVEIEMKAAYSKARGDLGGTFDPAASPITGGYAIVDSGPPNEKTPLRILQQDLKAAQNLLQVRIKSRDAEGIRECRDEIERIEGLIDKARDRKADEIIERCKTDAGGGARVVNNKLLGGWYVVKGPHDSPISGRFGSKEAAQQWLIDRKNARDDASGF